MNTRNSRTEANASVNMMICVDGENLGDGHKYVASLKLNDEDTKHGPTTENCVCCIHSFCLSEGQCSL